MNHLLKLYLKCHFKQTTVSFQMIRNQELIFSPFDFEEKSDTPLHEKDPYIHLISIRYIRAITTRKEPPMTEYFKIMSKMKISPC